jgi:hypothetical protein
MVDMGVEQRRKRDELARICPEYCARVSPEALYLRDLSWCGSWDSQQVGAWFAGRRSNAGVTPDYEHVETAEHKPLFGRPRPVVVATHKGWTIANRGGSGHLLVLGDGRTVWGNSDSSRSSGPIQSRQLSLGHLDEIARILGLPNVEIRDSGPA